MGQLKTIMAFHIFVNWFSGARLLLNGSRMSHDSVSDINAILYFLLECLDLENAEFLSDRTSFFLLCMKVVQRCGALRCL